MKTFTERSAELNLQPVGKFTTIATQIFPKSGDTLPGGESILLYFSEKRPDILYFRYQNDNSKVVRIASAYKYFRGFNKPPTEKKLDKMSFDGIATTPTGHRTEPDGYGPDGIPSWFLVLGLI